LAHERHRASELEAALGEANSKISKLETALRESYTKQFQDEQDRDALKHHFTTALDELRELKSRNSELGWELDNHRAETMREVRLHDERRDRLSEACGELSMAREALADVTSSKRTGLQRFFAKYDLPGVLIALFHKVLDLQGQLRCKAASTYSPTSPKSPRVSISFSQSSASSSALSCCEVEVRDHLCMHRSGVVSRHQLQTYIEGLHLSTVSPAMAAQVIIMLLDLDVGGELCDAARFVQILASPPNWEDIDILTTLVGVFEQPSTLRRRSSFGSESPSSPTRCRRRTWTSADTKRLQGFNCQERANSLKRLVG